MINNNIEVSKEHAILSRQRVISERLADAKVSVKSGTHLWLDINYSNGEQKLDFDMVAHCLNKSAAMVFKNKFKITRFKIYVEMLNDEFILSVGTTKRPHQFYELGQTFAQYLRKYLKPSSISHEEIKACRELMASEMAINPKELWVASCGDKGFFNSLKKKIITDIMKEIYHLDTVKGSAVNAIGFSRISFMSNGVSLNLELVNLKQLKGILKEKTLLAIDFKPPATHRQLSELSLNRESPSFNSGLLFWASNRIHPIFSATAPRLNQPTLASTKVFDEEQAIPLVSSVLK